MSLTESASLGTSFGFLRTPMDSTTSVLLGAVPTTTTSSTRLTERA